MNPVLAVTVAVAALFAVMLALRSLGLRLCAICASVTLTWAVLLALYRLGLFPYPSVVALLMGESVVGLYFLVERRAREDLLVFRLPFLLTLTLAAYALLGQGPVLAPLAALAAIWAVFAAVHAGRTRGRARALAARLIACCKNW